MTSGTHGALCVCVCVRVRTPLRFRRYIIFWRTRSYLFSAYVGKISDPDHSRSGHQVTWSDLTSEKVWMLVLAKQNDGSPWNFQRFISVTVSINCISRNFDMWPEVKSVLRPFHYKSMGEYCKTSLFNKNHLKHSSIGLQVAGHPESEYCDQWPLISPRSF